ncbi:TPA: phosphodiesterase [Pseudomonas aeruginosa]
MQIISHRGYWKEKCERNQAVAFKRSFDLGLGTETDVRDIAGKLVIAHDMPSGDELTLDDLLDIMSGRNLPLAINVKADGLAHALKAKFEDRGHTNWFVFDMAVPDMRSYLELGISTYTRMSEVEQQPAWLDRSTGVWLDGFDGEWYSNDQITSLLDSGKRVCIVSPELHSRPPLALWQQIQEIQDTEKLMICTDLPEQLSSYRN